MSPIDRDHQYRVRLSEDELAMLHALAEKRGVSSADVLRLYIREAYAETFGDKKPRRPKP